MADVVRLSRGGLWLDTPAGHLQFGAPSETLKDTLPRAGVPEIVVLPEQLFDAHRGLCTADLEFPIYYQLFVKRRPLVVVASPRELERIAVAVRESLIGPASLDLSSDVVEGLRVPDLRREFDFFRRGPYRTGLLDLDDAVRFVPIVEAADLGSGVMIRRRGEELVVSWDGREQARFPKEVPLPAVASMRATLPFTPPRFGVTTVGRSHGFDPDPDERTSGFVLWLDGHGLFVDPPVHADEALAQSGIDRRAIHGVLLTHCHADHDAGTLQIALHESRVPLYTTPSIFASYKRKWAALSGLTEDELAKLFSFRPVRVGEAIDIHGAQLLFRFTLHSIPTIGFEVHFGGRSFNYSSDTLNDPRQIEAIFRAGCMDRERRDELLQFDWDHDLIFHESGVPPLHTPLDLLAALPLEVRARLFVLHTTPSRLASTTGLQLTRIGADGTLALDVTDTPEARVLRNLELLGRLRVFADLPLARAAALLRAARELRVPAGARFITAGARGDELYVVVGGKAAVLRDGAELKTLGLGDYLGEAAVFLGQPRSADVQALTDLELLAIDGNAARAICAGTKVVELCRRQALVRELDAWSLLEETGLFAGLTVAQKTCLETVLRPAVFAQGENMVMPGGRAEAVFIVADGSVAVMGGAGGTVGRGAIVGDPFALSSRGNHSVGGAALTPVRAFKLTRKDFEQLLDENPGVRVRVKPWSASNVFQLEMTALHAMLADYLA